MKSLTDMAGDLDISTAQVLTAIRIVATRAGVTEVAAWATSEMEGYGLEDKLPAHRIWNLSIVGNMYNPVRGVVSGVHIGDLSVANQHRDKATTYYCRDGVGEIERMLQSQDDRQFVVENGNLAMLINTGPAIKKGWTCTHAWAQFSDIHLETIVGKARQTALRLCLECEAQGIELQWAPDDANEEERNKWSIVLREEGTKVAIRAAWEAIKVLAGG